MHFAEDREHLFYYLGEEPPGPGLFSKYFQDQTTKLLFCDVESISTVNRVPVGLGIATSPTTAFYFQMFPEQSSLIPWHMLKDPTVTTCWHNGLFDLDCLVAYDMNRNIHDTAIMSRLQAYQFNDLVGLSWIHRKEVHNMGEVLESHGVKNTTQLPPEVVAKKCMQDCLATATLFYELLPLTDLSYYNVERATIPIMLDMSIRGVLLDQEERQNIEDKLTEELDRLEGVCNEIDMFNPGSPQQVSYILAKRGAYKVFPRLPFTKDKYGRRTNTLSTNVKILRAMEDPLALIILEYRMYKKLLSTYIAPWKGKERAMTRYHLDAITGRPSSTSGGDLQNFRNMQNIPGKYRKDGTEYPMNCRGCLLPDSGVWTDIDIEQAEPRSLAHLTQDKEMLRIFSLPKFLLDGSKNIEADIHQQVSDFMGVRRKLGKVVNLAMTYGATDETLMEETGIRDKHRVRELKRMWFAKFPQAADWILSRQEDALRTGYAYSAYGRKMRLPTLDEDSADGITRKAIDYPCQSTAADILKRWLIHQKDKDIALQVHDELLIDGYYTPDTFRELENIGLFRTPYEIKHMERWG